MKNLKRDFKKECDELGWEFIDYIGNNCRVLFSADGDRYISNRAKFPPKLLSLKNAYDKTEWLVNYLNKKHAGKSYDFSGVKFIDYFTPVKGFCNLHGDFEIKINKIKESQGCKECSKKNIGAYLKPKDFKGELIKVHGGRYDYSKFVYENNQTPSIIICKEHGEFYQTYATHRRGSNCPKCSDIERRNNHKVSINEFLESAKLKHGDRYDYSLLINKWNGTKDYYDIICPDHGVFNQQGYLHALGNGCRFCNGDGWSKTSYIKMANVKNNGKIRLYLVRGFNDSESFFKIGITIKSVKERFSPIGSYKFEEIYSELMDAETAFDLEKILHKEFSDSSYAPLLKFGGRTECFSEIDIDSFKKLVACVA